jgi:O-antigen ligase
VARRLMIVAAAITTIVLAGAAGRLSVSSIPAAFVPVLAIGSLALLLMDYRLLPIFIASLGILLAGYAFAGRGFAYLGAPPIFIGEVLLFLAGLVLLIKLSDARLNPLQLLLIGFMFWGLFRTLPYLQRDGVNALRDAVLWGYALFAIALSLSVTRNHLEVISAWYAKLAPLFVCWVPVLFLLQNNFVTYLPKAPGSNISIPFFQADVVAVHLAGFAAFVFLGLYARNHSLSPGRAVGFGALWLVGFIICSSVSRGAFLASGLSVGVIFALRPPRAWPRIISTAALILLLLILINPSLHVRNRPRDISARQIIANSLSIFTGSEEATGDLEGTKSWRIEWWTKILDYTITGPYFWTGKGFGINLANDDGFLQSPDRSLRSPHNTHLTILARMGVPGFVLWIAINVIFVLALWKQRSQAERSGHGFMAEFIGWLVIYWLAMMIAGTFSLYLESPHTGIWFWTVFGLGLAVLRDGLETPSPAAARQAVSIPDTHSWSQLPAPSVSDD